MRNHATTLQRAGLPTLETLVRRILRTFDRATPSDLESGATWYDDARAFTVGLAAETGHDVETVAAVVAHLSPRMPWSRNLLAARELVVHGERLAGVMRAPYERAVTALDASNPLATLKGPKISSFARNIVGDEEAVTVDVWAARVVGVDPDTELGRVGVYDAVAHAYRLAARRHGVTPATMQATTWVVARNGRAS